MDSSVKSSTEQVQATEGKSVASEEVGNVATASAAALASAAVKSKVCCPVALWHMLSRVEQLLLVCQSASYRSLWLSLRLLLIQNKWGVGFSFSQGKTCFLFDFFFLSFSCYVLSNSIYWQHLFRKVCKTTFALCNTM